MKESELTTKEPVLVVTVTRIVVLALSWLGVVEFSEIAVAEALPIVGTFWIFVEAVGAYFMRDKVTPVVNLPEGLKGVRDRLPKK